MNNQINYHKKIFSLLALIYALVLATTSRAQDTIVLTDQSPNYLVSGNYGTVIEDTSSTLTISDIETTPTQALPIIKNPGYNRNDNATYWIHLIIHNKSSIPKWVLEQPDPHINQLTFYKKEGDAFTASSETGFSNVFSTREYAHKNYVYDLYIPKNETREYYVKIKSDITSTLAISISTNKAFTDYALIEYYLLGMFYGIITIMALYNLFLFVKVKDKTYLYYVLYVICCGLYGFSEDGLGFQLLWPKFPFINNLIVLFLPLALMITFFLYTNSFLELRKRLPKARITTIALMGIYFIGLILTYNSTTDFQWLRSFLYILPFAVIYIGAFRLLLKGYTPARFFIIGFTIILFSFFIFLLRVTSIVPGNIFTVYIFNFGFVVEATILSFALGDKLKLSEKESEKAHLQVIETLKEKEQLKDNINQELEEKVIARTQELEEKTAALTKSNHELHALQEDLYKMNSEMDKKLWKYNNQITKLTISKVNRNPISYEEFCMAYPTEETAMKYLAGLKWQNGYACRKCKNTKYGTGNSPEYRKCTKCHHQESITTHTLFHALKIPLNKAFYIAYVVLSKRKIGIEALAQELKIAKNTCWAFKKKVKSVIDTTNEIHWDNLLLHHEDDSNTNK